MRSWGQSVGMLGPKFWAIYRKEGDVYDVPIAVAKMSTLVATTIDDDDDDDEVREIP